MNYPTPETNTWCFTVEFLCRIDGLDAAKERYLEQVAKIRQLDGVEVLFVSEQAMLMESGTRSKNDWLFNNYLLQIYGFTDDVRITDGIVHLPNELKAQYGMFSFTLIANIAQGDVPLELPYAPYFLEEEELYINDGKRGSDLVNQVSMILNYIDSEDDYPPRYPNGVWTALISNTGAQYPACTHQFSFYEER